MNVKATALVLTMSAGLASAQVFYTDEQFYSYLEHRQRMAAIEEERFRCALEHQEA
jgi:hypothetical protein